MTIVTKLKKNHSSYWMHASNLNFYLNSWNISNEVIHFQNVTVTYLII
jgi:hypothetical protein